MYKSIYLTGAPATGKSTVIKLLSEESDKIKVFEYGKEMAKHLSIKNKSNIEQSLMKSGIESLVTENDINIVNEKMKDFIDKNIGSYHTIIDTHQITKEKYGFKLKTFSSEQLTELRIDEIWVLYCDSKVIKERIILKSGGRPITEEFESDFHSYTQSNLAILYSMIKDVPIYFFNSGDADMLYKNIMLRSLGVSANSEKS